MEQTLIIFKPSSIERGLVGQVIARFQQKGLVITGMKMMQLSEELLREHYAHLVDRPFFPWILDSMMASPVIVMALNVCCSARSHNRGTRARSRPHRLRRGNR